MCDLLIRLGRPAETQVYLNEATRLDPRETDECYFWRRASIQFHLEQYDNAVQILLNGIEDYPDQEWLYFLLAASYGHLGREVEGQEAIRTFNKLRTKRGYSLPFRAKTLTYWNFKDTITRELICEGLRKAGVPN